MEIAVVTTDTGSFRVHTGKCKSVTAEVRKYKNNGALRFDADTLQDIAQKLWGEIAAKTAGTDENTATQIAVEMLKSDGQIHDCLSEFPETADQAEPVYGVTKMAPRTVHLLKAEGTIARTLCGQPVQAIIRKGEIGTRTVHSVCTKMQGSGQKPLTADRFDFSGAEPRLAHVEVPGLGLTVPVETQPAPKAEPKVETKPVAKKTAPAPKAAQPLVRPKVAKGVKATAAAMLEWLPRAHEGGAITKSQIGSYKTVTNRLFAFAPKGLETDVFTDGLLDQLDAAFRAAEPGKSETTFKVYKGDLRKCVYEFFAAYITDPKAWEAKFPAKTK